MIQFFIIAGIALFVIISLIAVSGRVRELSKENEKLRDRINEVEMKLSSHKIIELVGEAIIGGEVKYERFPFVPSGRSIRLKELDALMEYLGLEYYGEPAKNGIRKKGAKE